MLHLSECYTTRTLHYHCKRSSHIPLLLALECFADSCKIFPFTSLEGCSVALSNHLASIIVSGTMERGSLLASR